MMPSGPDAYSELNEHHRKLGEEQQRPDDGKATSAQKHDPFSHRQAEHTSPPTQLADREGSRFTEEQQNFLNHYWRGFAEKQGEHARITPEHRTEAERLVLKHPSVHARDFADLERRESHIEQNRQSRLQHEAEKIHEAQQQLPQRGHPEPQQEQAGYRSYASEQERKELERQQRIEARINQHRTEREAQEIQNTRERE